MLRFRGLMLALAGFVVAALGYTAGPVLGTRAAIWLMVAGMAVCAVGFVIHLLQMFANMRNRR